MKSSRAVRIAAPSCGASARNSSASAAAHEAKAHAANPAHNARTRASLDAEDAALRDAHGAGKAWTRRSALFAAIAALAAPRSVFAQARVDVSLVDSYTRAIALGFARRRTPFIAAYERSGLRLFYVASRHDVAAGNATFRTIERAFRARPNALIVEGFASSWGWNPPRILSALDAAARDPRSADSYLRGEPGHAMALARAAGVPFSGGEPDAGAIDRALLAEGRSPTDIAGVKMLQWLPQGMIAGEFDNARDPRLPAFLDRTAARIGAEYSAALLFSREIYEAWHVRQFGRPVYEDDDLTHRLDPSRTGLAADISRAMTLIRDRHIFTHIMGALHDHNRLLVVYGGAHFLTQQRALRAALGRPRFL